MDKGLQLLGLIYRAKKMILGEDVLENLKNCKLIIIANDTSDKNKERYLKKCDFYNLEHIDSYSSDEISKAIGKTNIKLIGISDAGFAKSLLNKIKEG